MTLRMTMIVLIGIVLAATLVLGSLMTYLHGRAKIATEMESSLAVGSRTARNGIDDLDDATKARRRLELLVANFNGDRHLRAEVVAADGTVLLASRLAKPTEPAPSWLAAMLKSDPLTVDIDLPPVFGGMDKLVLRTDSSNELSEVWDDMKNALAILGAFAAMIVGLVYATIGRALRPLESLHRAFFEIGDKGYGTRMPEAGPLELARVYQGFNEMVTRLEGAEVQKRLLEEQLATVQEEERKEVARDLHDEIGPSLFAADVDATAARKLITSDDTEGALDRLRRIRESVGHVQRHVRDLLSRLRAGPLTDLGLAAAVEGMVAFWRGREPGIRFSVSISPETFGEPCDAVLYRVVQESVSNAVRHGRPASVSIAIAEKDGLIILTVDDDGAGLPPTLRPSGLGIKGMRERVEHLGGTLEVGAKDGSRGVRIRATIPLMPAAMSGGPPRTTREPMRA